MQTGYVFNLKGVVLYVCSAQRSLNVSLGQCGLRPCPLST